MYRPHGRAEVDASSPHAFAVCDRCGRLYNHYMLQWQYQWAGRKLQNLHLLVCDPCRDIPQPQLKTLIFPPDPDPVRNSRPEHYTDEEGTTLVKSANDLVNGR